MIVDRTLNPKARRDDIVDVLVLDCPICKKQPFYVNKEIYHPTRVLRDAYGLRAPE